MDLIIGPMTASSHTCDKKQVLSYDVLESAGFIVRYPFFVGFL